MTSVELERIARDVVPPIGATGWRITVLDTRPATTYAVVPILFGRLDGRPVFTGAQRDCHRFYELLSGGALRSAPRSVVADNPGDSAERGAGPSVLLEGRSSPGSRWSSGRNRRPTGTARAHMDDAPSPGASTPTPRRAQTTARATGKVTAAPTSDSGLTEAPDPESPAPPACKACGADLSALPPSRTGQRRTTCNDACRQAYHRGQRAPIPGVVAAEDLERLSRLSRRSQTASAAGARTPPAADGDQLALGAPA